MAGFSFQQTQRVSQIQTQRMSRQQIYSLNLLAMSGQDLRSEIYSAAEKNPALEVVQDPLASGAENLRNRMTSPIDYSHIGTVSATGELKADNFQKALESRPDERETLREHLQKQLNMMKLSADERELGTRLIENLDNTGFYMLAPISLLDRNRPAQNQTMLGKCIDMIQRMDPVGTCCANLRESLYVQALILGDAPPAALFILNGHFDFLDPPVPLRILKKIDAFIKEQKQLSFGQKEADIDFAEKLTVTDIETALDFIRTLDPYPAREFGASGGVYIVPDVYVTKIPVSTDKDDFERKIIAAGDEFSYRITLSTTIVPRVALSPGYVKLENDKISGVDRKFIASSVREAKVFIENLQFRETTIARACSAIVRAQIAFFEKGPRYLVPLRQKDIAEMIGVHEATISRMANSKYLQCEWGLFAVRYFFTNAVSQTVTSQSVDSAFVNRSETGVSKEAAKYEVAQILAAVPADAKPLSDQKVATLLEKRGIKIARRTVAKYRAELNIDSSYTR